MMGYGPDESYHLWGDYEYDMNGLDDEQKVNWRYSDPGYFDAGCKYSKRRAFSSEGAAQLGAQAIKAGVERRGDTYVPLLPYLCPDTGGHWHLTSSAHPPQRTPEQGYFHTDCRHSQKRAFTSEYMAVVGAGAIKVMVERRGEVYVPLYPYECPDGGHWHLTISPPVDPPEDKPEPNPARVRLESDDDPAVRAARRTIKRWTTNGWDASRDLIALEAARAMAAPIRELIENCEAYGEELDIDDLKKLVYAEWEL